MAERRRECIVGAVARKMKSFACLDEIDELVLIDTRSELSGLFWREGEDFFVLFRIDENLLTH